MGSLVHVRGRTRGGLSVTFEKWIQDTRLDQEKGKPCSGYSLVHRPSDKELQSVLLGANSKTDQEYADMFLGVAQSYAEGIAGECKPLNC